MAPRSKTYTGRYDETLAELADVVEHTSPTTEVAQLNRFALAFLQSVKADKRDTVHLSVNAGDDGTGGRTYTVTMSHTPAPPAKKAADVEGSGG